ncbi:23942_t:CDS:2 [Gigaspora rosea]|nr:23942_t:CDS:2 [Gigaspora rosea]
MVASSSSISSVILLRLDNSDAIAKNAEATQRIFECEQAIKIINNQDIKNELSSKIEADRVIIKHPSKRGRPRKQVDETINLNFRVAKDI